MTTELTRFRDERQQPMTTKDVIRADVTRALDRACIRAEAFREAMMAISALAAPPRPAASPAPSAPPPAPVTAPAATTSLPETPDNSPRVAQGAKVKRAWGGGCYEWVQLEDMTYDEETWYRGVGDSEWAKEGLSANELSDNRMLTSGDEFDAIAAAFYAWRDGKAAQGAEGVGGVRVFENDTHYFAWRGNECFSARKGGTGGWDTRPPDSITKVPIDADDYRRKFPNERELPAAEVAALLKDRPLPPLAPADAVARLTRELEEARAKLGREKSARVYYQDIVYAVCNVLDKVTGERVVCGTVETPTTQVADAMTKMLAQFRELTATATKLANAEKERDEFATDLADLSREWQAALTAHESARTKLAAAEKRVAELEKELEVATFPSEESVVTDIENGRLKERVAELEGKQSVYEWRISLLREALEAITSTAKEVKTVNTHEFMEWLRQRAGEAEAAWESDIHTKAALYHEQIAALASPPPPAPSAADSDMCDCSTCKGEGFVGRDGATCACIIAGCRKRHGRDAYLPPRKAAKSAADSAQRAQSWGGR